jgi:hypothetical protein
MRKQAFRVDMFNAFTVNPSVSAGSLEEAMRFVYNRLSIPEIRRDGAQRFRPSAKNGSVTAGRL